MKAPFSESYVCAISALERYQYVHMPTSIKYLHQLHQFEEGEKRGKLRQREREMGKNTLIIQVHHHYQPICEIPNTNGLAFPNFNYASKEICFGYLNIVTFSTTFVSRNKLFLCVKFQRLLCIFLSRPT